MNDVSFQEYADAAKAEGFDEVVERRWDAGVAIEPHTHPFSVKALVVGGEMWLSVGDATQHLLAGDSFTLDAGVAHAERYGSEGATYWAARRNLTGIDLAAGTLLPSA